MAPQRWSACLALIVASALGAAGVPSMGQQHHPHPREPRDPMQSLPHELAKHADGQARWQVIEKHMRKLRDQAFAEKSLSAKSPVQIARIFEGSTGCRNSRKAQQEIRRDRTPSVCRHSEARAVPGVPGKEPEQGLHSFRCGKAVFASYS